MATVQQVIRQQKNRPATETRIAVAERRIHPARRHGLLFALQVLLVAMVQLGNDIVRGNIVPPDAAEALRNAHAVTSFEASYGFFVEPAIQRFFLHSPHILGVLVPWPLIVAITNNIYAFAHLFVTLGVALWVFLRHRHLFRRLRNVMLISTILALVGYEVFPTAPPRLTTGLLYDGHLFHFRDTMQHVIGDGKLNGTPIGYNPFSAMPSLHVAWSLIVAGVVVALAPHLLVRLAGAVYPAIMVFTVVVTGNHYLMDALGAAIAVILAVVVTLGLERAGEWLRQSAGPEGSVDCTSPVLEDVA